MTAPATPSGKVMRFEVRDRPVNLRFLPCRNETFRLAEILSVQGSELKSKFMRDAEGQVLQFGYSGLTDYDVTRPGDYFIMFDGCGSPQSTITRRELGIQFMQVCC